MIKRKHKVSFAYEILFYTLYIVTDCRVELNVLSWASSFLRVRLSLVWGWLIGWVCLWCVVFNLIYSDEMGALMLFCTHSVTLCTIIVYHCVGEIVILQADDETGRWDRAVWWLCTAASLGTVDKNNNYIIEISMRSTLRTTFLSPQSDPMTGWKRTKPSYICK